MLFEDCLPTVIGADLNFQLAQCFSTLEIRFMILRKELGLYFNCPRQGLKDSLHTKNDFFGPVCLINDSILEHLIEIVMDFRQQIHLVDDG